MRPPATSFGRTLRFATGVRVSDAGGMHLRFAEFWKIVQRCLRRCPTCPFVVAAPVVYTGFLRMSGAAVP